jgi:hypothetical protein
MRYSPECVEVDSVLKKWLSARSAQENAKTSPKHYENDVFGPRTAQESAKEFFNTL